MKLDFLDPKGGGSVCFNRQNYNGYTFGRFPCPLPAGTGMNQLDQFCCGIANYQYCCNEQFVSIKIFFKIFYHSSFLTENTIKIKMVDLMMVLISVNIVITNIHVIHQQIELLLLLYQLLVFLL